MIRVRRFATLSPAQRADAFRTLLELREQARKQLAPTQQPLLAASTRRAAWAAHTRDPTRHSVDALAAQIGVSRARARAVLVLQGVEQYWREQGVFVGDAATLERTAAAAGFAVVQRSAEPPRDPAEAERPHRAARALIRGEVDEVELQAVAQRRAMSIELARQNRLRFPLEPPEGYAAESRTLSAAHRRTMRGRKTIVVELNHAGELHTPVPWRLSQTSDDPRLSVPIKVHERDGSVRTATYSERRQLFARHEPAAKLGDMEPIDVLRKYANTPIYYRGSRFARRWFRQYMQGRDGALPADPEPIAEESAEAEEEAEEQAEEPAEDAEAKN